MPTRTPAEAPPPYWVRLEPPPPPTPRVALTFSPIHLLLPFFELTTEVRVGESVGLAAILGAGKETVKYGGAGDQSFRLFEAGGQFRYYVTGNFRRGLEVGAEVLYVSVSGSAGSSKGIANGVAVGPFVGYKITSHAGFTFDVQGGIQRIGLAASASDSTSTSTAEASDWFPLLNLNIGWSL